MRHNLRFAKRLAFALTLAIAGSALSASADHLDDVTRLVMPAPFELTATGTGPSEITVTWKDVARTEHAYQLEWTLDRVNGPWAPATRYPIEMTACSGDNFGTPPFVDPDAPDGNILNQYNDPRPVQCGIVLDKLRNRTNTADVPLPFAEPATVVRWFRIRGIFPHKQGIAGGALPVKSVDFPERVQGLVHSAWSGVDPAILGPKPPANMQLVPALPSVMLVWANAAAGDPAFSGTTIERSEAGSQTPVRTTLGTSATSHLDGPLEYNKHFTYRVIARRSTPIAKPGDPNTGADPFPDHVEHSHSPTHPVGQGLTITTPPIPAPAAPTSLTATFVAPSTAQLQWFDNSSDEDGFLIEFGPSNGDWKAQTAVGPHNGTGFVAFSQFGIPADTVRFYRVFAFRVTPYAKSDPTNVASIVAIPKAPSDLVVQSTSSFQTVLRFKDNSNVETGFRMEYCLPAVSTCPDTGTDGWAAIPLTMPASPGTGGMVTFTDGRFANTTQKYRARAFNASGDSQPSNSVSSTTPVAPLNAPSNLLATPDGANPHRISLTWQDNTNRSPVDPGNPQPDDEEEAFRIEYKDPGGAFQFLATVPTDTTTYVDNTVPGRTTRCYRVRAVRAADGRQSDPSNTSCAMTVSGPKPPAPTNLVARPWDCDPREFTPPATPSDPNPKPKPLCNWREIVELEWVDNSPGSASPNEDYFQVEHSTDLQNWDSPSRAPRNATLHRVPRHYEPSSVHYFRIKAVNFDGESAYSNIAQVRLLGPPRPVWLHPSKDNTVATTACSVDGTFATGFSPPVTDVLIQIVRKVGLDSGTYTCYSTPGSCRYDKSTPIPEIPNQPNQVQLNWNGPGTFKLNFHFRKNVTYELHAMAINADGASADAFIATFVVLGDCPIGG